MLFRSDRHDIILAGQYNIMSIPTLLIFKDGEPVEQMVGAMSKDQLLDKIKPKL